jgi:hypothetical protein
LSVNKLSYRNIPLFVHYFGLFFHSVFVKKLLHNFTRIVNHYKIRIPNVVFDCFKFVLICLFCVCFNYAFSFCLIDFRLPDDWRARLVKKLKTLMWYIFAFSLYFQIDWISINIVSSETIHEFTIFQKLNTVFGSFFRWVEVFPIRRFARLVLKMCHF